MSKRAMARIKMQRDVNGTLLLTREGNVMVAGTTAASVHDKPGSLMLKEQIQDLGSVKKIVADSAYKGAPPFTVHRHIEWEIVERITGS